MRKDLAFLVKGGLPVPTYVLEYLLGQYCASDDEVIIAEGLEKVKEVIKNNYVHRADSESVKGRIRENGRHRIIDKVTAVLNEKADEYQATFANLGLMNVPIGTEYIKKNPKLLSGNGVWCIITIGYVPGEDVKVRWEIQSLKPIQISNVDVEEFIDQRKNFTTEEWLDFMMHTVGLNPENMNRREKFITLARLLPHVENNFNFVELGPKGTGKSHVFQELSPFGVLVSGGDVTSPRLFVRMSGKREELGLVGYWDVVAWDEFEQQKGRNVDAVLIDTMQNYLANKYDDTYPDRSYNTFYIKFNKKDLLANDSTMSWSTRQVVKENGKRSTQHYAVWETTYKISLKPKVLPSKPKPIDKEIVQVNGSVLTDRFFSDQFHIPILETSIEDIPNFVADYFDK